MEKKKLAYLPMAVDMIHPGHLNIINTAAALNATVMVGCYSDEAIASYKRLPFMNYDQRREVIESVKGVDIVVQQKTRDLEENIRKYKPDYVVHGTDWRDGALSGARERTIQILKEWDGTLVEPEYTENISSTLAHTHLKQASASPIERSARLRKLLRVKGSLKAMQVHDAISALIVENARISEAGQPTLEFDAFWLNEGTLALSKAKHDTKLIDFSLKRNLLNDIFDVTSKPLIFDGRNIIGIEQFSFAVRILERFGVSAIVIEDNEIDNIDKMIQAGKKNQSIRDFLIITKIKNKILHQSPTDVIETINQYIDASTDAIMLEYNSATMDTIISILHEMKKRTITIPLFIVANVYNSKLVESLDLIPHCIMYDNNMLSVAYNAMQSEAMQILNTKDIFNKTSHANTIHSIKSILPQIYIQ